MKINLAQHKEGHELSGDRKRGVKVWTGITEETKDTLGN
jgi:hypothetical protein